MQNHLMRSATVNFLILSFLFMLASSCQAGSMMSWHKIANDTNEEIFVTFFEGYPVNRSYSKILRPGEIFEIKDDIQRPGYYYVFSVTKNYKKEKEIVLRKMYSWTEYFQACQEDKVDGFQITEDRLSNWERDPAPLS